MNVKWLDERKEILAWVAAGLCLLALSLMATFPYTALHMRLLAELNRATGMEVRVTDWTAGWPLGLEWRNVTLSKPDWGPIQLAFLQARVGIVKALGGELGLDIVGQLDEGTATAGLARGTLTASSFSLTGPVGVKGQLQQVDLSKVLRRYVSHGVLNGDFSHRVDFSQATAGMGKGNGTWKAEVNDLAVEQIPVGNGRTLSWVFTKVSAGLVCQDSVCDVTELKGDGIDGSFTGEGKITLQLPMQNSQLALAVTVVPGAGFASKAATLGLPPLPPGTPMTVKILGTLAQTRVAL
ncbi:MAG: type II secretion system protein GspN [Nitrospiraceae bacterium]